MVVPVGLVLTSLLAVLPPLFIGAIVDALQHHNLPFAFHELLLYVGVALGSTVVSLANAYVSRVQWERFTRHLRLALVSKLHHARFSALENLTFGEIGNRITGDVYALRATLENLITPSLTASFMLVATIAVMVREDVVLAAVALAFTSLSFLPQLASKTYFVSNQKKRAMTSDEFYGALLEYGRLAALVIMRNAAATRSGMDRMRDVTQRLYSLSLAQGAVGSFVSFGSSVVSMIAPCAVLAVGAYAVVHGRLSTGTLVTLLIYQSRLANPIGSFSQLQVTLASLGVITHRLMEVAGLPDEESGALPFKPGTIALRGVNVLKNGQSVLTDVDLTVDRGAQIAIIGPSGAGKTSLALLMLRILDLHSGDVRVGGTEVSHFSLESLRTEVCVVGQEPLLFENSMLYNLTLTNPDADSNDLTNAIRICKLNGIIGRLPDGLNTRLGRRGVQLSGGECQRICLARGILQGASVLVLDEALSGVDLEMEREIITDLRSAFVGRTLIVITHRVASVADFDSIIVMDHGRIVAQGSHETLCRLDAWYANMSRHVPRVAST